MAGADERLRKAAETAFHAPFGAVLKIAPDGAAPLIVDGRDDPPSLRDGDEAADCVWSGDVENLARIIDSERAIERAVLSGRLMVAGDMSVMARIAIAGPAK